MNNVASDVISNDLYNKISGKAIYAADYLTTGTLHGCILRSDIPRGRVINIKLPDLPRGFFFVSNKDIPAAGTEDIPVFTDNPEYAGDSIGMLIGTTKEMTLTLFKQIKVEYEELDPVFDARKSDVVYHDYNITKGNIDAAFKDADAVLEGTYETRLQEAMYPETYTVTCLYSDGNMQINGCLQSSGIIKDTISRILCLPAENIFINQDITCINYNGNNNYSLIMTCQAAVAAYKAAGKPVCVVTGRDEVVLASQNKQPSFCRYIAAVKNGRVTGISVDILFDAGAYTASSQETLQYSVNCASGVYDIPNLMIHGHTRKTNTLPCVFLRNTDKLHTFFAIEMCMTHIATELGIDSAVFKTTHFVKHPQPVSLQALTKEVIVNSDYVRKRQVFLNQSGRYRGGIGYSAVYHINADEKYSWAVSAVEIEVDTLTGLIKVVGVWGSFDIGTPDNKQSVLCRIESNLTQSLGHGILCRIANTGSFPQIVITLYNSETPHDYIGDEACCELSYIAGMPAVIDAIQNALRVRLNSAPFLPQDVMEIISHSIDIQGETTNGL